MNRSDFDKITNKFVQDGVKKACYIVREYRRYERIGKLNLCAVTKEEYEAALDVILAHAYTTSDNETVVEQWQCDNDCTRNNGVPGFCPGEFQITKDPSRKLCKFFCDPDNI